MATIALTVDVYDRTDSTWWVSRSLRRHLLAVVIVGLVAGPLVDRLSRKRLIVTADLVRLAVFCALPFVGTPLAIIVLAAVAGIANSFFRPAVLAGVPESRRGSRSRRRDVAPAGDRLAGDGSRPDPRRGDRRRVGPDLVYWINAATFLLSALLLVRIPARLLQSEQGITRGHWRDLRDGFATFRQSRALVIVLVAFGLTMLASRPRQRLRDLPRETLARLGRVRLRPALDRERRRPRRRQPDHRRASSAGAGLCGLPARFPVPWAVGITGAAVAPNIWVAALAMALAGFGNGVTFPMTVLIIQEHTIDRLRGRAFTLVISVHNALLGLAMIAAGRVDERRRAALDLRRRGRARRDRRR